MGRHPGRQVTVTYLRQLCPTKLWGRLTHTDYADAHGQRGFDVSEVIQTQGPRVVAITVHRNDLEGLQKTCISVDFQDYPNSHHLIIDGASTDGSVAWLQGAGASNRRTVHSSPDQGIFDAMNKGISQVDGDIAVFVNAGDQLPDRETFSFVARSWQSERWRWGVGAIQYVTPDGAPLEVYSASPIDVRRMELGRNFIPHPAVYYEVEFLREIGNFRPEFSVAADQEQLLRCLRASPPKQWPRVMSLFEAGGASGHLTERQTQRLLHGIRAQNDCLLLHSAVVDRGYGFALATFRDLRRRVRRRPATVTDSR